MATPLLPRCPCLGLRMVSCPPVARRPLTLHPLFNALVVPAQLTPTPMPLLYPLLQLRLRQRSPGGRLRCYQGGCAHELVVLWVYECVRSVASRFEWPQEAGQGRQGPATPRLTRPPRTPTRTHPHICPPHIQALIASGEFDKMLGKGAGSASPKGMDYGALQVMVDYE